MCTMQLHPVASLGIGELGVRLGAPNSWRAAKKGPGRLT